MQVFIGIESGEHLLWCFAVGAVFAGIYAFYAKFVLGKLVRALIERDAREEDSAKTLEELGCTGFYFRFALRKGSLFSKSLARADGRRWFIPSENAEKLQSKYKADRSSLFSLLLALLLILTAALILAALLPALVKFFEDLFGGAYFG